MKKTTAKISLIIVFLPAILFNIIVQALSHFSIKIEFFTYLLIWVVLFALAYCIANYLYGPIFSASDLKYCSVDNRYNGKVFEIKGKKYSFIYYLKFRISKLKSKKNSSLIRRYKLCLKNPPPDPPSEIDFLALIIVLRTRQDIDTDFMNPEHLLMDISEYIRPNSQV